MSFNYVHKVEFVPMVSLAKKMACMQNMYSFCSTLNCVEMNDVHSRALMSSINDNRITNRPVKSENSLLSRTKAERKKKYSQVGGTKE